VLINWCMGLDLFTCVREKRLIGVGICRHVFYVYYRVKRDDSWECKRENTCLTGFILLSSTVSIPHHCVCFFKIVSRFYFQISGSRTR
jgi:hypothetical protein